MHIFFISPDRHLSQKYTEQWVMTSYGYANQWIIDPAPRNPGKTRVHRCPILASKCKVDLIFGYSTRIEDFWDGFRKASVFMHPGGRGRGAQVMGWGFDCFCWLWGGAFDSSASPGRGDIWTRRLGQRLRPIIDRSYVSHFTQCAVRSRNHGNQYKVNA